MFADDLLVCGQATFQEATLMSQIIQQFCIKSGQTPNWAKSAIMFSSHVQPNVIADIKNIFPVSNIDSNSVHLGHPLIMPSKDRSSAYNFILYKFRSKLSTYKAGKLSHAARLTLIKSVFASISVYYMSNIIFTKKFLSKLTAIIRTFWWTGVREEPTTKALCLRAWKDICTPKNEGGLGIRNLQATNQSLILSTAWRIAQDPNSQLYNILKSKYFHDTSIWRAKPSVPKSAFWTSVIKVMPLVVQHSFYQLTQGNVSIWSTPWCPDWINIYDHMVIQQQNFIYPAVVQDLWLPHQKKWNVNLIHTLFDHHMATIIVNTPIIPSDEPDILCWDLSPLGNCSTKSAYFLCLQKLQDQGEPTPHQVSTRTKNMLMRVWKCKTMAPRVQTFAWRILRRAIPSGSRAGRYSTHISKFCCRCQAEEDDIHLLFLCPFARAAWFADPWCIRSEGLVRNITSITEIIESLLTMNHPHASLQNIFTFLWCLWKSRNDCLFNRKPGSPLQIKHAAEAIIQGQTLQDRVTNCITPNEKHNEQQEQDHHLPAPGCTIKSDMLIAGSKVFVDASWKTSKLSGAAAQPATGIGVFMQFNISGVDHNLMVQASTPTASSPLQAEAKALHFAALIADSVQLSRPTFMTDSLLLAKAAAVRCSSLNHLNWDIRASIAEFFHLSTRLEATIYHISRDINRVAHDCAQQAFMRSQAQPEFSCINLAHRERSCPVLSLLQNFSCQGFVISYVLCT
jgi:hypothetical protein